MKTHRELLKLYIDAMKAMQEMVDKIDLAMVEEFDTDADDMVEKEFGGAIDEIRARLRDRVGWCIEHALMEGENMEI